MVGILDLLRGYSAGGGWEEISQSPQSTCLGKSLPGITPPMRTVEDIIALLGGPEAAASHCGVGTEAIRKWRQARAIPAKHWPAVLSATGLSCPTCRARPAKPRRRSLPWPLPILPLMAPRAAWCWPMGRSSGAEASAPSTSAVGEVCFNTSMTGYQEILTDPVLCRPDHHLHLPAYRQCRHQPRGHREHHAGRARADRPRSDVTEPANYRSDQAPE